MVRNEYDSQRREMSEEGFPLMTELCSPPYGKTARSIRANSDDIRNTLSEDSIITLRQLSANGKRGAATDFTIGAVIGNGSTSVCYEALHESGTKGRLKEFYPADETDYSLRRASNHQLIVEESPLFGERARKAFETDCNELIEAYRLLQEARAEEDSFNLYIPTFELYEGTDVEGKQSGTVYVWTANDKKIITFSDYLKKRVIPDLRSEKNTAAHLLNILTAIFTLSKCIRMLHSRDIFHMDIKPDNFGLALDENDDIVASSISLFDVNSMSYFKSGIPSRCAGTAGFRPRELKEGHPHNKSDLYAIGATLYFALMCAGDEENAFYRDTDYTSLPKLLSASPLIGTSDLTANTRLFDLLLSILTRSLHPTPAKRYPSRGYDGQVQDLRDAIYALYPDALKKQSGKPGFEIQITSKLVDVEEDCDEKIKTGAAGAIQRLLLDYPLYRYGDSAQSTKSILVIGSGTYAQKFIDLALEVSQIKGESTCITVASDEIQKAMTRYLNARPAFTKFFTVNGKATETGESYGAVDFDTSVIFDADDEEHNRKILDRILKKRTEGYAYVFIALGDDDLNRSIARLLAQTMPQSERRTLISFAQYKNSRSAKSLRRENEALIPVFVNDVISDAPEYEELRRMAFNCHVLWKQTLNVDMEAVKKDFLRPYHFNSSFSNVLSIKYKLHSLGIELDGYSREILCRAADETERALSNLSDLGELCMYEHRRWIVNNVCAGWDTLSDYSVLHGSTKDKRRKLHPCLVPCTQDFTLSKEEWTKNGNEKWNADEPTAQCGLDPLDKMSVDLHRHFVKESEKVSTAWLYNETSNLLDRLHAYPEIRTIAQMMISELSEIVTERSRSLSLYQTHRRRLEQALDELAPMARDLVSAKLQVVDDMMFPILESRKYTNYKETDLTMVRNIPFILTYRPDLRLCIPFAVEARGERNNRLLFSNVNAALTLNPLHITYIVDTDDFADDLFRLKKALAFTVNMMDARKTQTKLDIVFLRHRSSPFDSDDLLTVKEISRRIANVEWIEYANDEELCERVIAYFEHNRKYTETSKRRVSRFFSAIEKNATGTSKLLRGFGCYAKYPCYTVNPIQKEGEPRFLAENGCEYFNYIHFSDALFVPELFAAKRFSSEVRPPELPDYEVFWREYKTMDPDDTHTKNEQAWKSLCTALGAYAEEADRLGRIEISKRTDVELSQRRFLIPSVSYMGARRILKQIATIHPLCLGENPTIQYCTSDTCEISVVCTQETYEALQTIFSNPYYLCDPQNLRVEKRFEDGRLWAIVYFDNLTVTDLSIEILQKSFPQENRLTDILARLHRAGKLIAYRTDENAGTVSFSYASSRIKQVMTQEGKILELYVYYKALEENYFDDIVCSYTISDEDHVTNEFDLILTKGFCTMLVECKARSTLEQDFYHKLSGLNRQYGVNSSAVLVADTLEKPWWDTEANDLQRTRGRSYDIRTVYRHEDILHIGKKLRRIMEGKE